MSLLFDLEPPLSYSMGGGIKGRRGGTSKLPVQDPPALDLEQETLEGGLQSPCYADVLKHSHCKRLIVNRQVIADI